MKLPYLMPEEAKARQFELLREAQAEQLSQKMKRNRSNLLRRSSDFLMAVGQKLTRQPGRLSEFDNLDPEKYLVSR